MICHDIKKPFSLIRLMFNYLKSGRLNQEKVEKFSSQIEESMRYVNELLANLMIAGKEQTNQLEPFDLKKVVNKAWENSVVQQSRPFSLELLMNHHGQIFADKLRVERVFMNLFSNAMEAMDRPFKKIWVDTRPIVINERQYIEVKLGNEGSYIPEEDHSKLFESYYTRGKENGTGLGLAIVHQAVTSHGGQIYCRSEPNIGTEFVFQLPMIKTGKM